MKRLYRRLALTFTVSTLLLVLVFTISMYERSRTESGHYLNQLLDSVEINLEKAQEDYKARLELLKEDYLNRAWAVEYVLSANPQAISEEQLAVLKELMEVQDITLIGNSGEIILSTNEAAGEIYKYTEAIDKLSAAQDGEAYYIHIDSPGFAQRPESFYVTVGAKTDGFAAVRIDADISRANLKSRKDLIESTLGQATTEYKTSIIAVDKENGRIVGITENNTQQFEIPGIETTEELLEVLNSPRSSAQRLLMINGEYRSTVIREGEHMYLIAYSSLDSVLSQMFWSFVEGILGIGAVSVLTIFLVRRHLKKYLFTYFEQVGESISRILAGERRMEGSPAAADSEVPEIRPLVETILELQKKYIDKAEGMMRMKGELSLAQAEAKNDKLTGLYNRSGFEERVEKLLKSENPQGIFILFDLDNFKRINDMEGHPEGDRILERFAVYLGSVFRKGDSIGRLGGDEFVVLIPNPMSHDILGRKFDMLLSGMKEVFGAYYEKYDTSVSIGAVPIDGTVRTYKGLYKCADTALYIAKYLGKNRYYINEKKISCMRRECIRCRADCPRSSILNLPEKTIEYPHETDGDKGAE